MEYPSNIIRDLVEQLVKLPGIGKRSALRMVLSFIKQDKMEVEKLSNLLVSLKNDLKFCSICHTITDQETCNICNDKNRDKSIVCVVEDHRDLIAIENTNHYKGVYHVLGGIISPIEGVGPDNLKISSLFNRAQNNAIKELIFALSATMEGDTTMFFISKQLKNLDIKFSTLSRGISIGGELEFADEITLGRSIINRVPYLI